ncbi:MAG TPA: DUF4926 domain-containing protein [Aquabacterium sp.]|nr:DUF4926 domain-containing protein [Aquabacterium sp.]
MSFELHDVVKTRNAIPAEGIPAGARGTIVVVASQPREAYIVEFCDEQGQTLAMTVMEPGQLQAA